MGIGWVIVGSFLANSGQVFGSVYMQVLQLGCGQVGWKLPIFFFFFSFLFKGPGIKERKALPGTEEGTGICPPNLGLLSW